MVIFQKIPTLPENGQFLDKMFMGIKLQRAITKKVLILEQNPFRFKMEMVHIYTRNQNIKTFLLFKSALSY